MHAQSPVRHDVSDRVVGDGMPDSVTSIAKEGTYNAAVADVMVFVNHSHAHWLGRADSHKSEEGEKCNSVLSHFEEIAN